MKPILNENLEWQCRGAGNTAEVVDDTGWRTVELVAQSDGRLAARGEWKIGKVEQPFWCVPGLFWGDNQQDSTPMLYPRFTAAATTPNAFRSSSWQFHVARLSQPLVACHDGECWHVCEAEPFARSSASTAALPISLGFAYRNGAAFLCCGLPPIEEPYRHVGNGYTEPRVQERAVAAGERITWRYRLLRWRGERATLLEHLQASYHESPQRTMATPPHVAAAAVAQATRNGLIHWHYAPQSHCFKYTVAYDRLGQQLAEGAGGTLDSTQMHLGWASGWVIFEPLLDYAARFNDAPASDAVVSVWQHLRATATSPSGFWWARYVAPPLAANGTPLRCLFASRRADGWDGGWLPNPQHIHLRTIGDAVLRAARVLRNHGARLPFADALRADVVRQARQMARFAEQSPILPLAIDAVSGEVQPLAGTAGLIWISVWIELLRQNLWSDRDLILRCADAYRTAVASGNLFGAPEDVGESISSEDVHIALNAFCNLYAQFHRPEDLDSATRAARWLYLWRRSFHVPFSPRTVIGAYHLSSVGGEFASAKNNHFHVYGLDVDDSLRQLTQWTGDARWAELADDHWRFAAQLVALEDGQFNGFEGMLSEQFYFSDWSCLGNSVARYESDPRQSAWDVGPYFRNHGNLSGFSTVWCVAFALRAALHRIPELEPQKV